jgi:hypothetical protein
MANSASNTASALVSAMPVRVLVASRKTTHFQQHGFVVWMISNWMALYSMAVPQSAGTGSSSDYLATSVDCTSSRSASTFATTAAVAVTTAKVTIAKASPMSFKPSVSAILAPPQDCYPNAYRTDAAIPAAMRLAIAANVQSGRALRVARSVRAFAKIVICLTNSQTLGELDKKGRSMSVHPDRSHQLAISHVGISQGSNDADRPRQHPCARLSARPKPDQQQPLAEIPHPFLNSKNAASTFNSVAMKKLLLFPENMIPLCCAVQNESCRKGSIEELAKLFEDYP